jgi:nucleotide-binding universal stress UspA family protein
VSKGPAAPVVVGVDGSPSALDATRWAADDCARHHVPLRLVHAVPRPFRGLGRMMPSGEELRQAVEAQAAEWLRDATAVAREVAPQVAVTARVDYGGTAAFLVEESREARLMVLGSHGHGAVTGLLVGSTALALAAHAMCPLVVVRGTPVPDGPVVVGVDGSPTGEAAIAFAFDAASLRGATLTAVMAYQDFLLEGGYHSSRIAFDWAEAEDDERRLLAQRLAGWQEKYPDVRVDRVVRWDRAARALQGLGAQARLLVVGSHGRGGFAGMLLGSTSRTLVYHAPCPLVIVRSA